MNNIDVRLVASQDHPFIYDVYDNFVNGIKAKPWFKYIDKLQVLTILNNSSFIIQNKFILTRLLACFINGENSTAFWTF